MFKNTLQFKPKYFNYRLMIELIAISVLGILLINSATSSDGSYIKQVIGLVAGVVIMISVAMFNHEWIMKLHWLFYAASIILLVLVLVMGHSSHGAQRWIKIASGITIQPSEFAKVFMVVFWAWMYGKNPAFLNKWPLFILSIVLTAVIQLLIVIEPDLSTTILFTGMFITIIFLSGFSYKKIAICFAVIVPIVIGLVIYIQTPDQKLLKPYQLERIQDFISGNDDDGGKEQQENAVLAIGSGQLTGKGLNYTGSDSVKNGNYLYEADSDFIFAIAGEELGFLGSCTVIGLLALISFECILTGIRAADMSGRIVCYGMATIIVYQTFINIGVVSNILPNTGIPLPFVSSGLSSLIALYFGMGLVQSVRISKKKSLEEANREHWTDRS